MKATPQEVIFRAARREDLVQILRLLADIVVSKDPLQYADEVVTDPPLSCYEEALSEILSPPNEAILGIIGEEVVAYAQITYVPGLTRRGQKRAIIEDVRVSRSFRGFDIGRRLMEHCAERAKEKGCWVIQLTTNVWREDAIAFYEKIGFQKSHVGFRIQF